MSTKHRVGFAHGNSIECAEDGTTAIQDGRNTRGSRELPSDPSTDSEIEVDKVTKTCLPKTNL